MRCVTWGFDLDPQNLEMKEYNHWSNKLECICVFLILLKVLCEKSLNPLYVYLKCKKIELVYQDDCIFVNNLKDVHLDLVIFFPTITFIPVCNTFNYTVF